MKQKFIKRSGFMLVVAIVLSAVSFSIFAADKYYANESEEIKGKIEYNRLQKQAIKNAAILEKRRKLIGAKKGDIVMTNDEIDSQLNLLGRLISHPEGKKAVDFVNNAKVDEYIPREVDEVDMSGFDKNLRPQGKRYEYKSNNGGQIDENELFPIDLGRQQ